MKIGTDCSGIDAPIQALTQMGISFEHVFSSDIDKYCVDSIKSNYNTKLIFGDKNGLFPDGDITKRDIDSVPDIDMYVCGFPCQPFSQAGGRKGFEDSRGNVFWSCMEVIKFKQPKYFILENVKNILRHDNGNTWKTIWGALCALSGYSVKWKILNTRNYGIPQNREIVWIVGVKEGCGAFTWPEPVESDKPLLDYVDNTDTNTVMWKRKHSLDKINKNAVFVDVDFLHYTNYPNAHIFSPCVVARGSSLWCVPLHRYANTKEFAGLQGFPSEFKQVVSNCQMKKQYGNSMSVNVLIKIFESLPSLEYN